MPEGVIAAACDCGSLKFESTQPPLIQLICHCADCRDATKEEFTVTAFFDSGSSRAVGDTIELVYTAASGQRTTRESCRGCGAVMFDKSAGFPTLIGVVTKFIQPPFESKPACHVWVKSRLATQPLCDALPTHEEDFS